MPLLMAPNMSLAVNLLVKLVGQAAATLRGKGFDVEILERHHRFKKDSPSGTALHFARIVQEAMGQSELRHGRHGLVGERPARAVSGWHQRPGQRRGADGSRRPRLAAAVKGTRRCAGI